MKNKVQITGSASGVNRTITGILVDSTLTDEEIKDFCCAYRPFGCDLTKYSDGTFDLTIYGD